MILANLYNKVLGFFRQTDAEQQTESTKDIACNRLRVVLMQDRTNLTPELMERMRKELVELLSKYVEMDKEALELNLEQDGDQVALMLSIPVIRAKDEEEIKAALEENDSQKAYKDENLDDDTGNTDSEEESEDEPENESEDKSEDEPEKEIPVKGDKKTKKESDENSDGNLDEDLNQKITE